MRTAAPEPRIRPTISADGLGWLTLYLFLLLFIPSRLVVGPLGSAGAPSMLFGLGSLLLWLLICLVVPRTSVRRAQPIRIALGIFLFCAGVSYVLAMSHPMSPDEISPGDVALLAIASWSGTLLLTHDGVPSRDRLNLLVWRFAVCGGLIALLGLVQVLTRQLWVDQLSIPGLSSAPAYGLVTRGGFPRPSGTATHPIEYGVILAMLLPITLHVGFHHSNRSVLVRWLPALAVGSIVPLTSSRSAYLGASIALIFCMIGWSRIRRLYAIGIVTLGALAMMVIKPNFLDSVIGLFTGAADDASVLSRTDSFSLAFEFITRNPWFGRGLGTFLPKYRILDNEYLLLLVTIGLVGTTAFVAVGLSAIVAMFRLRRTLFDVASRDLAMSLAASVTAGFVCLCTFDAFAFPMAMGTLFFVIGISGALWRIERSTQNPHRHYEALL